MFRYVIHTNNSPIIFKETCKRVKEMFPEAIEQKLLVDVDGSTIQTFTQNGKDIDIIDDYDIGVVFVQSEIEIKHFN